MFGLVRGCEGAVKSSSKFGSASLLVLTGADCNNESIFPFILLSWLDSPLSS